ncbi:hypothetical protein AB0D99_10525 [Streptomyces sp. NPDC047971]|uniref:hypothetical protein n=1 Tax=Streptomyces sp. NPDC047971 TaxID=3154499 RepID=UPI0033DA27E9
MCENPIEDGYLCPGCTRALADRLGRMPRLYTALAPFLTPGAAGDTTGGRTGRSEAPLPVVEHVLDLRGPGGIVGVLEDWHAAMQRDRHLTPPPIFGSVEGRITRAAFALRRNAPSLAAEWPAAGLLAREIHDLERSVASIAGAIDHAPRGQRLGPCPAQHTDGSLCGAILHLRPGDTIVTCPWCSHTYPPGTWSQLKQLIDHDEQQAAA